MLETLDSLLASSRPGEGALDGGNAMGGSRETVDAASDLRPFVGDLDAAVAFCRRLRTYSGIVSVVLGVRLQSRASSQELEVYLAKGPNEKADQREGAVKDFKLVLRQGMDVQECVLSTTLGREDVKGLAALVVQSMR